MELGDFTRAPQRRLTIIQRYSTSAMHLPLNLSMQLHRLWVKDVILSVIYNWTCVDMAWHVLTQVVWIQILIISWIRP